MGWFRRNKQRDADPQSREGVLIDWDRYLDEIEEGTRPGLPHDRRHWVMMADSYPGEMRLLWEKAVTHREAKQALKNLKTYCRMEPLRLVGGHFDDVDGMWSAQQPQRTIGLLNIWHPNSIGRTRRS